MCAKYISGKHGYASALLNKTSDQQIQKYIHMKRKNLNSQLFFKKQIISRQLFDAINGGINDLDNDDEDEDVRANTHPNICVVKNEKRD